MKTIFRRSTIHLLVVLFFINTACDPNNWSNSTLSPEDLAGVWLEQEDTEEVHFTGSTHKFLFEENGEFQLEEDYWTDMLDPDDPCSLNRIDYVEGTFSIRSNQISFEGTFMNSDFTSASANCEGKTKYNTQAVSCFIYRPSLFSLFN